jgi:peptide/nickel transport system substrate-binding protein
MLYAFEATPYPVWGEYDVYQPLVVVNLTAEFDEGTIQYLPALAQNWTVSGNGSAYTFNLRQNVTFSNGDPFNAYQVWAQMYAFYYLSDNSSAWLYGYPIFNMSSADFGPATINLLNQSGLINPSAAAVQIMSNSSWPIYVNGPYQITFRLIAPFPYFLGTIVTYAGLIFDVQWVLDHGGFGTPTNFNDYFNQNPMPGTGPYMLTGLSEGAYVKYAQNPTYWALSDPSAYAGNVALDPGHVHNVVIYVRSSDLARYADLSTGTVQIAAIESEDWDLVITNPQKFSYLSVPNFGSEVTGLSMNTLLYPTNITAVRQAIAHAINYSQIFSQIYHGDMTPLVGPEYPLFHNFYDLGNYPPYSYNITLADQDMTEAHVNTSVPLTFPVDDGCDYCVSEAEIIQGDLAQLNLTVDIQALSISQYCVVQGCVGYSSEVANPASVGNLGEVGGPENAPTALTPADAWTEYVSNTSALYNNAIYYNPVVQACVNSFFNGSSVAQSQTLCTAAQGQLYNDAPYAWFGVPQLFYAGGSIVWDKGVISGLYADPLWTGTNLEPIFNTVTFG